MKAYKCNHSGLLLPPDYIDQWGIKYGHGLGPEPVSECFDTDYRAIPKTTGVVYSESKDKWMMPFKHTKARVEQVDVTQAEYDDPSRRLITSYEDPDLSKRKALLRNKQKGNAAFVSFAGSHGVPLS